MGYIGSYGFGSSTSGRRRSRFEKFGRIGLLSANLASLALGVIYLFVDDAGGIWNLYGLLLLLTLLGNLHITMGNGVHKVWEYLYLALHALGLTAIPVLNTMSSAAIRDYDARSLTTAIVMLA